MTAETIKFDHVPVLPEETVSFLSCAAGGNPARMLDCTLGRGGHAKRMLEKFPQMELAGIDCDSESLAAAEETLAFAGTRVHFLKGKFSDSIELLAASTGWKTLDAVLMDIGVSSPQIDDPARGFSYVHDGPLDMRMDRESPLSASRILNTYSVESLIRIFMNYGDLDYHSAKRLSEAAARVRETKPFSRTGEFAELCMANLHRSRRSAPPVPSLPFQALRIAVNSELDELSKGLENAVKLLNPGGRLCVISFHSLEDGKVKNFMRDMAVTCKCPPGLPVCICGWKPKLRVLTKKPVTAGAEELERNPRAACAKLRVSEKI